MIWQNIGSLASYYGPIRTSPVDQRRMPSWIRSEAIAGRVSPSAYCGLHAFEWILFYI